VQDGNIDVLGFSSCARVQMCVLRGYGQSSYSASYKHIPRVTQMKLLHIDSSVLWPHSSAARFPPHRGPAAPIHPRPSGHLPRPTQTRCASVGIASRAGPGRHGPRHRCSRISPPARPAGRVFGRRHRRTRAPMYNFTIPASSRPGSDRVLVAGKTFKYDARVSMAGRQPRASSSRSRAAAITAPARGRRRRTSRNLFALGVRFIGVSNPNHLGRRNPGRPRASREGGRGRLASRDNLNAA